MASTPITGSDEAALPPERPHQVSVDLDGDLHRAKMLEQYAGEAPAPIEFRQWEVERLLGSGGMGKVYLARHRQLGRLVALKVLKPALGENEVAATRFIREAQAMAQVRHDNVLQVHQVDTSGERAVIEMEYIEGPTLREWQSDSARSWRTIVEAYLGVADGLAALHAADLLHRDIKPENLLIDAGGRVKIVDLGLAVASREAQPEHTPARFHENSALALRLTADGAIIGTLGYMAPEVLLGDEVTKAADQFSLAVSLYEAVYGVRPFAGNSAPALADAISTGKLSKPSDGRRRPRWLLRALRRALNCDPELRFASVRDLAEALRRGLRRRQWLSGFLGIGVVVIGLPTATWFFKPSTPNPCVDAGDALAAVWNDEARRDLGRRTEAAESPQVARSFAVLERVLDQRTQAWREASTELCIAQDTRPSAGGDASLQAEIDRRQRACLDTVKSRIAAMVSRLRDTEHELARYFTEAAGEIEALPTCDDRLVLASWHVTEADPEAESALAEAIALEAGGEFVAAEALARRIMEGSRDEDPLRHAEALYRLGHILGLARRHTEALDLLDQARNAGYANGQDQLVCRALAFQVKLRAAVGGEAGEAARELGFARACVSRVGAQSPILLADLLEAEGLLARATGDFGAATQQHERALELRRDHFGDDHQDVGKSLLNLANSLADGGQPDAARQRYEQCIELRTRLLGAQHPELADVLFDYGVFAWTQSDSERARSLLQRALDIYTHAPGSNELIIARIHQVLASMDLEQDRLEAADAQLEHVRNLHESGRGQAPLTVDLARRQHLEGLLALRRQMYVPAADSLRRAAELYRQRDPEGGETLAAVAAEIEADYGLGDFARIAAIVRDEGVGLRDFVHTMDTAERGLVAWYIGLALRDQSMEADAVVYLRIALDAYEALGEAGAANELRDIIHDIIHDQPNHPNQPEHHRP